MSHSTTSAHTATSETLLRRWQQDGDRRALDLLLRIELPRLSDRIRRESPGLLGSSVGATDAAQEAAVRLLERGDEVSFDAAPPLRRYLWNTAWRYLTDRFRRRRRKSALEDPGEIADASSLALSSVSADLAADVLAALRRLSWRDREVIDLVYLHQVPLSAASEELGITTDAVRMRLARARERLREELELGDGGRAGGA